ncbi:MAG TPA: hypothetical protein VFS24_01760 [Steroidobacteraceae bacterium]|nr:hypothetical protein [Steroidobacteraceae bacterium]
MNTPDDKLLDDYLRGDSELSRQYRELPSDDVPAELDNAVLDEARKSIEESARTRRWRKWTPPFALAASAVLALSILFRSGGEREVPATVSMQQVQLEPEAQPQIAASGADTSRGVSGSSEAEPAAGNVANEPAMAPKVRVPAPPPVVAPAPSVAPSTIARSESRALAKPTREKIEEAAPSSPAIAQTAAMESEPPARADSALDRAQEGTSPVIATPSALRSAPAEAEFKKAVGETDATQVAERWLRDIRKLRADGRIEDADRQWREFRKRFPQYFVSDNDTARPKPSGH